MSHSRRRKLVTYRPYPGFDDTSHLIEGYYLKWLWIQKGDSDELSASTVQFEHGLPCQFSISVLRCAPINEGCLDVARKNGVPFSHL